MNKKISIVPIILIIFMFTITAFADSEKEENSYRNKIEVEEYSGVLGTVSIVLGALTISILVIRWVNKYIFNNKSIFLRRIRAQLSKFHPYLGLLMTIVVIIHGYLLISERSLLCYLIFIMLLLVNFVALLRKKLKIKKWLIMHRIYTYTLFILVISHIIISD